MSLNDCRGQAVVFDGDARIGVDCQSGIHLHLTNRTMTCPLIHVFIKTSGLIDRFLFLFKCSGQHSTVQ